VPAPLAWRLPGSEFDNTKGGFFMRTSLASALLVTTLSAAALAASPPNPHAEEAKGIIKQFATTLQGELQAAIKAGGAVNAINVCQERAPAIARSLSEQTGWDVGRTSLRLRNPGLNAPDAWESGALQALEERKAAGADVQTLAIAEVVDTGEGRRFRMLKAIPTGEVCLACHGKNISSEVVEALDKAYPEDQARGFSVGDIRGAFSLSKPL
jgi:hypothetical protein